MPSNADLAELLTKIAQILEIQGENPFKVRAYSFAARTVEGLGADAATLAREGKLGDLPGFGEGLVKKIAEWAQTGRMTYFEEVRRRIPDGLLDLLKVRALGPKRVKALWETLGVTGVAALETACRGGRVAELPGFGEALQAKIIEGLAFLGEARGRFLLSEGRARADELVAFLRELGVQVVEAAGSVRRGKDLVKDLDLVAAARAPAMVIERFVARPAVRQVAVQGDTRATVTLEGGMNADLRVVVRGSYAAALQYFTGSKDHNVALRRRAIARGFKLNEYGLFKGSRPRPLPDEKALYAALGLDWIAPELREGRGEIELAEKHALPELVEFGDVAGVFHVHSTWSDGTASIEEMAEAARKLGLGYLGLSDHTRSAAYAGGLDAARFRKQGAEIDRLNARWKDFRILKGAECDILKDGRMDLPDSVLARLDFVIGAVHSNFELDEEAMTERIVRAIRHPLVRMIAHPTGRLLLQRDAYRVDLRRVLEEAAKHGKIVEINSHPSRLDLDAAHARILGELGGSVSLNPDAHSTAGIADYRWGVVVARRAGLSKRQVLNTRPWEEIRRSWAT